MRHEWFPSFTPSNVTDYTLLYASTQWKNGAFTFSFGGIPPAGTATAQMATKHFNLTSRFIYQQLMCPVSKLIAL
jgi:hypothetical protein